MKSLIRHFYRRLIDAAHRGGTYRGVFRNFAEARHAVPKVKPIGYDHAELASWYRHKWEKIGDDDYPALFWLGKSLADSDSVFEIGGHVGVAYYGFSKYLDYPPGLKWEICEVPSIAEVGRQVAQEKGIVNLRFVESHTESQGADILFAVGSLQYIEGPGLDQVIRDLPRKPKHIIVNKIPVWDGPTFVTLQSIGFSCCPYLVRNHREFVSAVEKEGYFLRESWIKTRTLQVRFRFGRRLNHYTGYYFQRLG